MVAGWTSRVCFPRTLGILPIYPLSLGGPRRSGAPMSCHPHEGARFTGRWLSTQTIHGCLVYLPTFTIKKQPNVGRYTIQGSYGYVGSFHVFEGLNSPTSNQNSFTPRKKKNMEPKNIPIGKGETFTSTNNLHQFLGSNGVCFREVRFPQNTPLPVVSRSYNSTYWGYFTPATCLLSAIYGGF